MQWEEDGKQALALNTRAVNVIWGGEGSKGRYWQRTTTFNSEDKDNPFEVLELIGVHWLELTGKIPLNLLTPGTTYTFFVKLKLTSKASGWRNTPVIFRLHLPRNTEKSAAVDLSQYADGEWVDVPDGGLDFAVPQDNSSGVLSFAMYEFEGEEWKKGLIVKDVNIVPQKILKTII